MDAMGYEINGNGKCEWRNNGGVIERRFLYADDPQWETVANSTETPRTADELKKMCEKDGFGYEESVEWAPEHNGNIIINNTLFEVVGEGYPEAGDFDDVFVCHNYRARNGSTAKTWHPVDNMAAFNDGDLDCCDWDDWEKATVEVEYN